MSEYFYDQYPYPRPEQYIAPNGMIGSNVHMNTVGGDTLIVGCGTISGPIIARDNPNVFVYAIDKSVKALEWASVQAKKEGISNLELIEADITNWKHEKKFSSIIASCVLHHIPDIDAALQNIRSMMDEKGVMFGHVYRKKGRGHIIQTRRMLQATGRKTPDQVREYLEGLSEYHPSRIWYEKYIKVDQEIADTWLNPYAVHYSPKRWVNVLGRNGFTRIKWQQQFIPRHSLMGFHTW